MAINEVFPPGILAREFRQSGFQVPKDGFPTPVQVKDVFYEVTDKGHALRVYAERCGDGEEIVLASIRGMSERDVDVFVEVLVAPLVGAYRELSSGCKHAQVGLAHFSLRHS